jgi:protein-S-isoprenylcysteine O-methyltransferase Ste14
VRTIWKVLLGVFSCLPIAFFVVFFFWLIPAFFDDRVDGQISEFERRFNMLLPVAMATSVVLILLLIVYGLLLARRTDLQIGEKIGVPVVILFTNGILLPLVWWFYIWRESNLNALSRRAPAQPPPGTP